VPIRRLRPLNEAKNSLLCCDKQKLDAAFP